MLCKRIVLSLGLFFVIEQAHAGDANRAFAAVQGGDFDAALIEWMPLAEQVRLTSTKIRSPPRKSFGLTQGCILQSSRVPIRPEAWPS